MLLLHYILLLTYWGVARAAQKDYQIIHVIGKGSSCTVYLVQHKQTRQNYAMKVIRKAYVNERRFHAQVMTERDILAQNRSPFTLRLYEAFDDDESLYFITPFLQGGDLMGLMITYDIFPLSTARFYLAEILLGLEYLHAKEIAVRDLKFENILVDKNGHLKICDFGLAGTSAVYESNDFTDLIQISELRRTRRLSGTLVRSLSKTSRPTMGAHKRSQTMIPRLQSPIRKTITHKRKFKSLLGTPETMAHEILQSQGYSSSCDLWSMGCLLYEMLLGYSPFAADTTSETLRRIERFNGKVPFPEDAREYLDADAMDLITKLICFVPNRSTISEIKRHPFFDTIEFNSIHLSSAPIIPQLDHDHDLKYFPLDELKGRETTDPNQVENFSEDIIYSNFGYTTF